MIAEGDMQAAEIAAKGAVVALDKAAHKGGAEPIRLPGTSYVRDLAPDLALAFGQDYGTGARFNCASLVRLLRGAPRHRYTPSTVLA